MCLSLPLTIGRQTEIILRVRFDIVMLHLPSLQRSGGSLSSVQLACPFIFTLRYRKICCLNNVFNSVIFSSSIVLPSIPYFLASLVPLRLVRPRFLFRRFSICDSPQIFRQGVGAFRNARDLAKEQREIFIEQANAVARAQSVDTMSFDTSNSQDTVTSMQERVIDSDTSADELALDYPSPMSRTKRQKVQTRPSTSRSMQEKPSSTRGEPRSMREESRSTQEYSLGKRRLPNSRKGST